MQVTSVDGDRPGELGVVGECSTLFPGAQLGSTHVHGARRVAFTQSRELSESLQRMTGGRLVQHLDLLPIQVGSPVADVRITAHMSGDGRIAQ